MARERYGSRFQASLKRNGNLPPARVLNEIKNCFYAHVSRTTTIAPFGDAYEKIGTIQRRLAWPLHKDDTLFQSGRPTGLNIYFSTFESHFITVIPECPG